MPVTDGLWIWLWNLDQCDGGDYDAIAARCLAAGVTGLLVKAADGGSWFPQRNGAGPQTATQIVAALKARGLRAGTWSYCYGRDIAAEAQRAADTINEAHPDLHVLDIEQEFEDGTAPDGAATNMVSAIRATTPDGFPLAYSPLPAIDLHLRLPYRQFTDARLTMLPQLYWTGLQWSWQATCTRFWSAAERYTLLAQPVAPAYEDAPGVRPSDDDVAAFTADCIRRGVAGISIWSYEHMDGDAWRRATAVAAALHAAQPAPATATAAALQAKLDALIAGISDLLKLATA